MPDFYIKIKFKECSREQFELVFKSLASDNIFRITNGNESIELECKIDNFLPSVVLVYNVLNKVKDCISSVESYRIVSNYDFNRLTEFVDFIFSSNENKILGYYEQMGYLALGSDDDYYKQRAKLKKYYKKLNNSKDV